MKFGKPNADVFVPDGRDLRAGLERTTHLAIGAHQDDIEIMAYHGIAECFGRSDMWFAGVVVTNGAGSPRTGIYKDYSDEQMQAVRQQEQRKAAVVGEYGCLIQLMYSSSEVKNPRNEAPRQDLRAILELAQPQVVYLHNPADKHDTHVAVCLRAIAALRDLAAEKRPSTVLGVEVWRDLDWLCDEDKQVLAVDKYPNLSAALLGIFDSQISGGKRYDLATAGRRLANATYFQSHAVDEAGAITFAMDLGPLIRDHSLSVASYASSLIEKFRDEVKARIERLGS
ncbi:MAG: PIG-L family deacetylase [Kiritimatiellae bacterium]|nr:PIG-L family deacetylase [Kiritimatiellia bacterium]